MKPLSISEASFQNQVCDLAFINGWELQYHVPDSRKVDIHGVGFPDWIFVKPPRILYIELKGTTGKLKPEQQYWLENLLACGQEAYAFWPEHWTDVESLFHGKEILLPEPKTYAEKMCQTTTYISEGKRMRTAF